MRTIILVLLSVLCFGEEAVKLKKFIIYPDKILTEGMYEIQVEKIVVLGKRIVHDGGKMASYIIRRTPFGDKGDDAKPIVVLTFREGKLFKAEYADRE